MIVGSRSREKDATAFRGVGKKLLHTTAHFLTKIKIQDLNSGMKLYRTELAKNIYTYTRIQWLLVMLSAWMLEIAAVALEEQGKG